MKKDAIYLGGNKPVNENDLCVLIVNQLSKDNEVIRSNMVNYPMDEIRNISSVLIHVLGGSAVEARTFNAYFHETVNRLGYSEGQLTLPTHSNAGTGLRI